MADPLSPGTLYKITTHSNYNVEVCPNCGTQTNSLHDFTGWCERCSAPRLLAVTDKSTKLEAFLAKNADRIEYSLLQGNTLYGAIKEISAPQHRPRCVVCGKVIKRSRSTAVFCRANEECRRWSRRYVYLYTYKSLDKSVALAQVFQEIGS